MRDIYAFPFELPIMAPARSQRGRTGPQRSAEGEFILRQFLFQAETSHSHNELLQEKKGSWEYATKTKSGLNSDGLGTLLFGNDSKIVIVLGRWAKIIFPQFSPRID